MGSEKLDDGLIAYLHGDSVSLPFVQFMESLNIPISRQKEPGVASGWFRSPDQQFILDVSNHLLSIGGHRMTTEWDRVTVNDDDIYVDSTLIKQWLGIKFRIAMGQMQVRIDMDQDLPLIARLKRRRHWKDVFRSLQTRTAQNTAVVEPAYSWVDWPAVDNDLRWQFTRKDGGVTKVTQYDLLAAGDFLHMTGALSTNLYSASDGTDYADTRLQLRNSPTGSEPRVVVGDYAIPPLPLVFSDQDGTGILVSTFPQDNLQDFSEITLRGDALNGWDVELYQNNELIDFTTVTQGNQFQFKHVPLRYGLNLFRMVFYGPQGQVREKTERYYIGKGMAKPRDSEFLGAVHLLGHRLLTGVPPATSTSTAPPGSNEQALEGYFNYRYGLSDTTSLSGSVATGVPDIDTGIRHQYAGLQVQTNIDSVLYDVQYDRDLERGWAGSVTAQTYSDLSTWSFGLDRYEHFSSPTVNPSSATNQTRQIARASWRRVLPHNMAAAAQLTNRLYANGDGAGEFGLSLSANRRRITLASGVSVTTQPATDPVYTGNLLANLHMGNFNANGQLRYEFAPTKVLQAADLNGVWNFSPRISFRGTVQHQLSTAPDQYSAGVFIKLDKLTLATTVSYSTNNEYTVSIDLFSSFHPVAGDWFAAARPTTSYGSAVARVFIDKNGNGRLDQGDEPIKNARFSVNSGGTNAHTDKQGVAVLDNIPADANTDIHLKEGSLQDPYWTPVKEDYQVHMRPAKTIYLDYPVVISGEIDGTVYLTVNKRRKPASNVTIQLLPVDGSWMKETKSAYDGYYIFDKIKPGKYIVRLSTKQLERLELDAETPTEKRATITGDGDIESGLDFSLALPLGKAATSGNSAPAS